MLGLGDKKRLAMIIVGKPKGGLSAAGGEEPSSSSAEDFVDRPRDGSVKESIPSDSMSAMDDAMDAFLVAVEAKDRPKAVKAFKSLVSLCESNEEEDSEEM
jgi:hypothetical protein